MQCIPCVHGEYAPGLNAGVISCVVDMYARPTVSVGANEKYNKSSIVYADDS